MDERGIIAYIDFIRFRCDKVNVENVYINGVLILMRDKVDKGFALNYWRLSYRRKFIRTLWMTPVCICIIVLLWIKSSTTYAMIWTVIIVLLEIIQLVFTFYKWKSEQHLQHKS